MTLYAIISGKRIYFLVFHVLDVLRVIKISTINNNSFFFNIILIYFVVFSVRPISKVLFKPLQNAFFLIIYTKRPTTNGLFPIWQNIADPTA